MKDKVNVTKVVKPAGTQNAQAQAQAQAKVQKPVEAGTQKTPDTQKVQSDVETQKTQAEMRAEAKKKSKDAAYCAVSKIASSNLELDGNEKVFFTLKVKNAINGKVVDFTYACSLKHARNGYSTTWVVLDGERQYNLNNVGIANTVKRLSSIVEWPLDQTAMINGLLELRRRFVSETNGRYSYDDIKKSIESKKKERLAKKAELEQKAREKEQAKAQKAQAKEQAKVQKEQAKPVDPPKAPKAN